AYKAQVILQGEEEKSVQERTYSLEVRGVGVGIHQDYQSIIWEFIKKKNNNFSSIYSQNPNDYKASLS
ncbi:type VI lipase adapter Tla3 domain-containing protein, partial [Pseudomonas syringae group genomosp. 3]